jgi:hypothetical protein
MIGVRRSSFPPSPSLPPSSYGFDQRFLTLVRLASAMAFRHSVRTTHRRNCRESPGGAFCIPTADNWQLLPAQCPPSSTPPGMSQRRQLSRCRLARVEGIGLFDDLSCRGMIYGMFVHRFQRRILITSASHWRGPPFCTPVREPSGSDPAHHVTPVSFAAG